MNIALDQVLRALCEDEAFRRFAREEPDRAAGESSVPASDLRAALDGDVVVLHERGAHPLLIMAMAATMGVDPMSRFGTDPHRASVTPRGP